MISGLKSLLLSNSKKLFILSIVLLAPLSLFASEGSVPSIGPIRIEFIIFGLILLGVALFHHQTFWVAVIGLTVLLTFKLVFDPGFHLAEHIFGENPMADQIMDKGSAAGRMGNNP